MNLLYIVKNQEFEKNQIVFLYQNLDNGVEECLIKTYFPELPKGFELADEEHPTLDRVLKKTIEKFITHSRDTQSNLKIVFENNDSYLSHFLRYNFKNYLLSTKNLLGDNTYGVTFTKRVSDYFNSENNLKLYKKTLTLKDYICEKVNSI